MRISELIEQLEKIRGERGNLQVQVYNYGDISHFPATAAKVCNPRSDEPYVLVEP